MELTEGWQLLVLSVGFIGLCYVIIYFFDD